MGSFAEPSAAPSASRRHSVPARRVTSARSSANATKDVKSSAERTESGGSRSDESTVRVPGPRGKTNRPVGSVPEPPPPPPPRASRTSGAAPSNHRAPHAVASSARAPVSRVCFGAPGTRRRSDSNPRARGVDRAVSAAAKDRRDVAAHSAAAAAGDATKRVAATDGEGEGGGDDGRVTVAASPPSTPRGGAATAKGSAEAERPFRRTIRREAGDAPAGGRDRDTASGARGFGSRLGSTREPRASSETAQYSSTTTIPSPSFPARGAAVERNRRRSEDEETETSKSAALVGVPFPPAAFASRASERATSGEALAAAVATAFAARLASAPTAASSSSSSPLSPLSSFSSFIPATTASTSAVAARNASRLASHRISRTRTDVFATPGTSSRDFDVVDTVSARADDTVAVRANFALSSVAGANGHSSRATTGTNTPLVSVSSANLGSATCNATSSTNATMRVSVDSASKTTRAASTRTTPRRTVGRSSSSAPDHPSSVAHTSLASNETRVGSNSDSTRGDASSSFSNARANAARASARTRDASGDATNSEPRGGAAAKDVAAPETVTATHAPVPGTRDHATSAPASRDNASCGRITSAARASPPVPLANVASVARIHA